MSKYKPTKCDLDQASDELTNHGASIHEPEPQCMQIAMCRLAKKTLQIKAMGERIAAFEIEVDERSATLSVMSKKLWRTEDGVLVGRGDKIFPMHPLQPCDADDDLVPEDDYATIGLCLTSNICEESEDFTHDESLVGMNYSTSAAATTARENSNA